MQGLLSPLSRLTLCVNPLFIEWPVSDPAGGPGWFAQGRAPERTKVLLGARLRTALVLAATKLLNFNLVDSLVPFTALGNSSWIPRPATGPNLVLACLFCPPTGHPFGCPACAVVWFGRSVPYGVSTAPAFTVRLVSGLLLPKKSVLGSVSDGNPPVAPTTQLPALMPLHGM